jgi:type IV secretion system protein VirB5
MKRIKGVTAALVLMGSLLASNAANAGIPVIDAANLVQSILNIVQWGTQQVQMVTQIQNQVTTIQNQITHIKDITGTRNLGQVFNNPLLQQIVPANTQTTMTAINSQGFNGMTQPAQALRTATMIYNCMDVTAGPLRTRCQAVLSNASQRQATQTAALQIAQQRVQEIQSMQQQINTTQDPKAISEVQAALAAETAQVQNDLIRVTLANQMADAQDQAATQAVLERHLTMMRPNAPSVADNIVLN